MVGKEVCRNAQYACVTGDSGRGSAGLCWNQSSGEGPPAREEGLSSPHRFTLQCPIPAPSRVTRLVGGAGIAMPGPDHNPEESLTGGSVIDSTPAAGKVTPGLLAILKITLRDGVERYRALRDAPGAQPLLAEASRSYIGHGFNTIVLISLSFELCDSALGVGGMLALLVSPPLVVQAAAGCRYGLGLNGRVRCPRWACLAASRPRPSSN